MSENKTDEEIKNRLSSIFPDPQVASKVVDIVVNNRPSGWSRRSNAPYYKRIYAEQMKLDIDKMIASGNPLVYRYNIWCNEDTQMSKNTLYTRINQSIRYLVEQMDTKDKRYDHWYQTVHVHRRQGLGIMIEFIPGFGTNSQGLRGEEVQPREHMPRWKQQMEDWLESDNITPFCIDNLALSPDEIAELKVQFAQLTNVAASITSAAIKIIRMN